MAVIKSRRSLVAAAILIFVAALLVLFEFGCYAVITLYVYPKDRAAFFEIPKIEREDYEDYLAKRHPDLGWPFQVQPDGTNLNLADSRPVPAFPIPGSECVSTYGDSFTFGEEVEHEEAWGNILSQKLGCRVANYGVGGYGTDQALIRFLLQNEDSSSLVVLGILPHNLMRNVNQYRYFLTGGNRFGFKPRFTIDDEALVRVPIPDLNYEHLIDSFTNPQKYYQHEAFLPMSELGPIVPSFPYSRVFFKYVTSERVRNYLSGWPGWRGFVNYGHRSAALEVTIGIIRKFSQTAAARKKRLIVMTFPTARSYQSFVDGKGIVYQSLLESIDADGIAYLDLHEYIRLYLGERQFCELLTNPAGCIGHFNAEGNAVVADALFERIGSKNFLLPE